jgi:hypothetical protein
MLRWWWEAWEVWEALEERLGLTIEGEWPPNNPRIEEAGSGAGGLGGLAREVVRLAQREL